MLKIKKKEYSFNYEILFKSGSKVIGKIENSILTPYQLFLKNKMTIFSNGTYTYFNIKEIASIIITDLTEKIED